jgi:hypothetical protein
MTAQSSVHLFILGKDYHLGDLLWFTAVLAAYRRQVRPGRVLVGVPDRPISRILGHNLLIDDLLYGEGAALRARARAEAAGAPLIVRDLRVLPMAISLVRQWRRRLPWLYYADLWMQPRGQWLATFLGLGVLRDYRPELRLVEEDRAVARRLPSPYVVLAPHVGTYTLSLLISFWRRVKGWPAERWSMLARQLRQEGYHVVTLAAAAQRPVPGTIGLIGLPIRQVAGVIERAAALVTVESGLWFVAAALETPVIITPWWLPRSVDWAAPMNIPHRLVYRGEDSVDEVLAHIRQMDSRETA